MVLLTIGAIHIQCFCMRFHRRQIIFFLIIIYLNTFFVLRLGLKGRPERPIGCLGTSKVYRVMGKTVLCYPLIFSANDFYLSHDIALLTTNIRSELQFIGSWRLHIYKGLCFLSKCLANSLSLIFSKLDNIGRDVGFFSEF